MHLLHCTITNHINFKRMNTYTLITNQIIANIKNAKSWSDMINATSPVNITGRPYNGINRFLLGKSKYKSRIWGTFKQITQYGGRVKKGEKSSIVALWMRYKPKDATGATEERWYLKLYHVFNVEQCTFIDGNEYLAQLEGKLNKDAIPATADKVVSSYLKREHIQLVTVQNHSTPYYSPAKDLISITDHLLYKNNNEYLMTLYHEIVHSTGHPKRLHRFDVGSSVFGSHDYSLEELVAEIGANFLSASTGVSYDFMNSVAYIKSWIPHLEQHPRWIVSAASKAERAVESVLNC